MCTNNNTANAEHQLLRLAELDANGKTLIPDVCVWGGVSVLANNVFVDIRHVNVWRGARMVWMKEYHNKIRIRSVAPIMLLTKYYAVKKERKNHPTYYSIQLGKAHWTGHVLHGNWHIKHVTEGKTEGTSRKGRRRKELPWGKENTLEFETGNIRSQFVETVLCNRGCKPRLCNGWTDGWIKLTLTNAQQLSR